MGASYKLQSLTQTKKGVNKMKKTFFTAVLSLIFLLVSAVSCSKPKDTTPELSASRPGSDNQGQNMFDNLTFTSFSNSDRDSRTSISNNIISGRDNLTVCIVTVNDIDKSGCKSEKGTFVPIEIRIDSVIQIQSDSGFDSKAGDTVLVSELSAWFKDMKGGISKAGKGSIYVDIEKEDGYSVSYHDGLIPITEKGAQYIVCFSELQEGNEEYFPDGIQYLVEALTIPFNHNSGLSDNEIYEMMKLPDDVVQCSVELLDYFIYTPTKTLETK